VREIYNDNLERDAAAGLRFPCIAVRFETGVIAAAAGIALYFAAWAEPDWRIAAGLTVIVGLVSVWRQWALGGLVSFMLIGFTWSALHTARLSTNPVNFEQRVTFSGVVVNVDRSGPMRRLTVVVQEIEPLPRTGSPKKVRIRVGRNFPEVSIGEGLNVQAVISPLPGPAVPNGYDPGRRAFFDGLAGSGFAIRNDPQTYKAELAWRDSLKITVDRWRQNIAKRVLDAAPQDTAGLQVALLTGLRDYIPDHQRDALRASGLAHILAISGLHMGMVAFGVFAFVSLILAFLPQAASRDMRKPAAIFAILAATLYLGLSGASVATQRAYVMVSIAFIAMLLDRRALSLRSVAVAAAITLAIRPEALMSVGFQMSFAAVTALVVVYREWADRRPANKTQSLRDRFLNFYGSLAVTSFVAGLATGGFAMFHFGRIAKYGLLGNLAAMAVFPLVMIFGITGLLLLPFGLEAAPFWVMGQCLRGMLFIAESVAGLPGAVGTVKASHPVALAVYAAGFTSACFATRNSVTLGISLIALSAIIWWQTPKADIRISDTGRVSVLSEGAGYTSSARADRYGRDQFSRATGDEALVWRNYRDGYAFCDALACRFEVRGHWVTVANEASEVQQACKDSALVILPNHDAGIVARRGCSAILLDASTIQAKGGAHVTVRQSLLVTPIADPNRANRPWG
jgi:competence protein ComEC